MPWIAAKDRVVQVEHAQLEDWSCAQRARITFVRG